MIGPYDYMLHAVAWGAVRGLSLFITLTTAVSCSFLISLFSDGVIKIGVQSDELDTAHNRVWHQMILIC